MRFRAAAKVWGRSFVCGEPVWGDAWVVELVAKGFEGALVDFDEKGFADAEDAAKGFAELEVPNDGAPNTDSPRPVTGFTASFFGASFFASVFSFS